MPLKAATFEDCLVSKTSQKKVATRRCGAVNAIKKPCRAFRNAFPHRQSLRAKSRQTGRGLLQSIIISEKEAPTREIIRDERLTFDIAFALKKVTIPDFREGLKEEDRIAIAQTILDLGISQAQESC